MIVNPVKCYKELPLLFLKNDYTCIEIAIFAIANRKGYQ